MSRNKKLDFTILITVVAGLFCVIRGELSVHITAPEYVIEGDNYTLTCKASNCNGTCIYKFTLGDISTTWTTLKLTDIKRHQTKTATCTVRDDSGEKEDTKTFDVYFGPDPVTILPTGSKITKVEGNTWPSITCSSTCNPSPCTFIWKKDGTTKSTTKTLFDQSDVVSRSQAGSYTCKASNTFNSSMTAEATIELIVHYSPEATLKWDSSRKKLTCTAIDGIPSTFTFQMWKHEIENVFIRTLSGDQANNVLTYTFATTSYQDNGIYTCTVSNGVGSYEIPKAISIPDKPKLVTSEPSYNVSKYALLRVIIDSYAVPEVTNNDVILYNNASNTVSKSYFGVTMTRTIEPVLFHGKNVRISVQKITIFVPQITEDLFGTLNISISNSKGSLSISTVIYPEGPPDPPVGLKVSQLSHNEVTLAFRSGFFNGASQTFVVQYRLNYEGSTWLNGTSLEAGEEKNVSLEAGIANLEPETTYQFRAYGYNIYARSKYTDVIVNATTHKEPLPLAAIIGGSVGGTLLVVVVIVVLGALWRYSSLFKGRKKASYKEPSGYEKANKEDKKNIGAGHDNSTYGADVPYENSQMQNGQITTAQDSKMKPKKLYTQENIYINANDGQTLTDVGQPYMTTKLGPSNNGGSLIAADGYIDLQGGSNKADEAYAVSKIKSGVTVPDLEEDYVDMNTCKVNNSKVPLTRKTSKPQYSNVSSEISSKPQYSNVSNQIGLNNQELDDDKAYVTMNAARSPHMTSKMPHGGEQDATYVEMNTSKVKTKNNIANKLEGIYVAMNNQKPKSHAGKSSKPAAEKSPYLNLREEGVFNGRPPISTGRKPGNRTSGKDNNRDSMPSYEAPAPPGFRLPGLDEKDDDYMNINVQKSGR